MGTQLPSNYGHEKNFIKPWVYAIWAIVNLAALGTVAVKYSNSPLWWGISLGVYALGIFMMIKQIAKSGDTTLAPYVVQTIGVLIFWISAAA